MQSLAGLAVVVTALLLTAPAALATTADDGAHLDELGLAVTVGYDGRTGGAAWQPVTVALEPARPLAGTLAVSVNGNWGPTAETARVEVAAGSRKLYRFLAPAGDVRVTLAEPGRESVTVRPPNAGRTAEYLAGLLGTLPAGLPPLRSELVGRSGAWVALDPAWVERSSLALEPLGAVVTDVAGLQALSPEGLANLAAGVAAGTDLVVTGVENVELVALGLPWRVPDDAWRMTAADLATIDTPAAGVVATAFPVGYARVITTPLVPGGPGLGRSGELWSQLVQPSGRAGADSVAEYRVAQVPHQFGRLLAEQGSAAPALPWLGAFVVVYVLVVGPVNGALLARLRRRELAWATVPLVTVIFTAGAFLGATTGRPPTGSSARLVYWNDGTGSEFVAAGVRAPTPGTRSIQLPGTDWTVRPVVDNGRQGTFNRGEETTVALDLTALQLGGVAAWRTLAVPPPLEVAAAGSDNGVAVTVRNTSGRPLSDVAVRVATTTRRLPDLAAGATETLTIDDVGLPQASAYRDPFEGLDVDLNGVVGAPASLRAVLHTEVADGRPGMVWVSAVDPSPGIGARSGRESVSDHGAVVAVGVTVEQREGLSALAIQRDVFVTANGAYRPGPQAVEGAGEAFLRFRLPPGADTTLLANQLDRSNQSGGVPQLTVWDRRDRQWVDADEALTDVQPERVVSALGEVWVRASGELFPFEFSARTIAGGGS